MLRSSVELRFHFNKNLNKGSHTGSTDIIKDSLKKLDLEKAEIKGQLDEDRLMTAANTIIKIITCSEFLVKMCQPWNETEKDDGYEAVAKTRSLEGLRATGVKIH